VRAIVAHPGPHFSVADVHDGWLQGLTQCGVQVMPYNLHDRLEVFESAWRVRDGAWQKTFPTADASVRLASELLYASAYTWWPQMIVVVSGFFVPTDVVDILRDRGHRMVLLATESPYQDDQQLVWAEHYDTVVLNDPTHLDRFQAVTDAVYIPHGHDPDRHRPGPPDPRLVCDFGWVGTAYQSRIDLFEAVDWAGLTVRLAGNWQQLPHTSPLTPFLQHPRDECCPNDETVALYQSTVTSANLYRREANAPQMVDGWAMGPREVELAACGTWFARDPRPESDEILGMFPTFTTAAELGEQVRWALTHPDERDKACRLAREAVADRTFTANAQRLLAHIDL
jgi:spore maturation protein CgeB